MKRLVGILGLMFLAALGSLVMTCSKSGSDSGDDGNSPFTVLDLRAVLTTDSSVTLAWTATGDDSNSGTASLYDLRYYPRWVNRTTWDSAYQITGEPHPREAGQTDSMTIGGLEKDSTYYFALQVADEAGNKSGVSNCAVGCCFTDIVVTFPDLAVESRVRGMLSIPTAEIHRSDMLNLGGTFDGNSAGISSLAGLQYAVNLPEMLLADNSVSDLAPLGSLHHLLSLQMAWNDLVDISPLAGATGLRGLILAHNQISDISALSGLHDLHIVYLEGNQISDLTPLIDNSGFAATDTLSVVDNPLSAQALNTDIPALEARGVFVMH